MLDELLTYLINISKNVTPFKSVDLKFGHRKKKSLSL